MVVACLALLLVLGGTGVAAVMAVPNNSVGTAQLKNSAVTGTKIASNAVSNAKIVKGAVTSAKVASNAIVSAKIANGAVSGGKIAANAITSAKVADHTLLAADFAPGQVPKGPTGAAGPAGTVGTLVLRTASISVPKANSSALTVSCQSGEQAVSGGATWSDKGDFPLTLGYSNPVYDPKAAKATGWTARGRNQTTTNRTFIVQVLCGKAS